MEYINLLITKLKEKAKQGIPCDMCIYYNLTTFEILADLAFGEPFHVLETGEYNKFMKAIFGNLRVLTTLLAISITPVLSGLFGYLTLIAKIGQKERFEFKQFSKDLLARRVGNQTDKKDFMSYILRYNDNRGLSQQELEENAEVLVIAGSETSATALSGMTYHLLTNPECLQKLQEEVRGRFQTSFDIVPTAASQLPYLKAVIEESMRLYPSIPSTLPRVTTETEIIDGVVVPPGCSVAVANYAAAHSTTNFQGPEKFAPERWLGNEAYAHDIKAAFQPFSLGPRNCIGRK